MKKLLIVDDDASMRGLFRMKLSDNYEVFDTGDPEQAIAMALEYKPDAVLLDLMMPKFSGLELCQSFHSLSYTSYLPIFVVTGASGVKYKEHCGDLGATAFFEKPVDFARLKGSIAAELDSQRPERRSEVRVRMRVALRMAGVDALGNAFEDLVETENVSASGFLCTCMRPLVKGTSVQVRLASEGNPSIGTATVVRKESPGALFHRYGFLFSGPTTNWVLQKS